MSRETLKTLKGTFGPELDQSESGTFAKIFVRSSTTVCLKILYFDLSFFESVKSFNLILSYGERPRRMATDKCIL